MEKKRFDPAIGRKGRQFIVMAGIVLQPEAEVVWQEGEAFDSLPQAAAEMDAIILERVGIDPRWTASERREAIKKYDGPPIIVLERTDVIRAAVGCVEVAK